VLVVVVVVGWGVWGKEVGVWWVGGGMHSHIHHKYTDRQTDRQIPFPRTHNTRERERKKERERGSEREGGGERGREGNAPSINVPGGDADEGAQHSI
jgi:transcription initiation factor IIF auxiliary subunit